MKKSQKKNDKGTGLLSNKSICLMIVMNLIFNSIVCIKEIIHLLKVNLYFLQDVGLPVCIFIIALTMITFDLLLLISLVLSIINIRKPKLLFLVFILVFSILNLILVLNSYFTYHDIFWLLYIIQSVLLCGVIIIRLFKYKKDK